MQIARTVEEVQEAAAPMRASGERIGLVPAMGALHEGHLSLMRAAREENGFVVASVFVNPTQFVPNEDLESCPRRLEADARLASETGVALLFAPSMEEMYGEGHATTVEQEGLSGKLCGQSRPTHFRGVLTVVAKLLNQVGPDRAYFGQKDAQQAILIKRMVRDLDFDVEVRVCPTVREEDGLAMSSRNGNLSAEERAQATCLHRALARTEELFEGSERKCSIIREESVKIITAAAPAKLDYFSIVDVETLEDLETIGDGALAALSVYFGKTRLIDNVLLGIASI